MSTTTRLLGFKYLKLRRILTLALIAASASMLFLTTALSLLGFYRAFNAYLGEGEDIVAIYDRRSGTPFTGLVPAYLAERVSSIKGVIASSPEVITPCIINGESAFLRGIIPEAFAKLNQLTIVEGDMLKLEDANSIIVGKNVAERLRLSPKDGVLIQGVLSDQYLELQVKGIYKSQSVMDDEALVPLYVGQWLRGADYGHVTLIRVKIERGMVSPAAIFEEVAKEASEPSPSPSDGHGQPISPIVPWLRARFRAEDIGIEETQRFMMSYLEKYGVGRESLLVLSVMVFLLSSTTIALALKTILIQHKGEINVLRSIGASKKLLKRDVLIKLLPSSIIASFIGFASAMLVLTAIQEHGYLQALSHNVPIWPDPIIIALNFALTLLLASASTLRAHMNGKYGV